MERKQLSNKPVLSVVVPVYNVERYIEKCLLSILSQTVDTSLYEIVVVNDGTPDDSMSIAERLLNDYTNVVIVNQENGGLSVARNTGLRAASGQYVWFVDSDDWVEEGAMAKVLNIAQQDKYDIIVTLLQTYSEADGTVKRWNYNKYLIGTVTTGWQYFINEGRIAPTQQFVFRKDFLDENNLTFLPGVLHEDGQFGFRAFYLAKDVYMLHDICYNYLLRNGGSIMSTIRMKNLYDLWKNYQTLIDFEQKIVKTEHRRFWEGRLNTWLVHFYFWAGNICHTDEYKSFMQTHRTYIKNNIYKMLLKHRVWKMDIKYYVLVRFFPHYSIFLAKKKNVKSN